MKKTLKVGACQIPEIIGDIDAAIDCMVKFAAKSAKDNPDILLFPECFLQGYIIENKHLKRYALDVGTAKFQKVLKRLKVLNPTLVFGFIEQAGGKFYNSAAVVNGGSLMGVYRKTHLTSGESLFETGKAYPVFTLKGIKFGINICYDTQFAGAAKKVANQGAELLLVPSQNMMRIETAKKWKNLHNKIRAERVRETKMWLISSDVTGRRDKLRVSYGPTAAMNPKAEIVAQVPLMQTGVILVDVRV